MVVSSSCRPEEISAVYLHVFNVGLLLDVIVLIIMALVLAFRINVPGSLNSPAGLSDYRDSEVRAVMIVIVRVRAAAHEESVVI